MTHYGMERNRLFEYHQVKSTIQSKFKLSKHTEFFPPDKWKASLHLDFLGQAYRSNPACQSYSSGPQ